MNAANLLRETRSVASSHWTWPDGVIMSRQARAALRNRIGFGAHPEKGTLAFLLLSAAGAGVFIL